jgi:hypothetical protein
MPGRVRAWRDKRIIGLSGFVGEAQRGCIGLLFG